jgi:hypothetical protein
MKDTIQSLGALAGLDATAAQEGLLGHADDMANSTAK